MDEFRLAFQRIKSKTLKAIKAAGQDTENYIRQSISIPYPPASSPGQPPHMRSGELLAGIGHSVDEQGDGIVLSVTSQAPHSTYLEYGTAHMAPRPFMRPAYE